MRAKVALGVVATVSWIAAGLLTRDTSIHVPLAIVSIVLIGLAFAIDGAHLRAQLSFRAPDVIIGLGGGLAMAAVTRLAYETSLLFMPVLGDQVSVLYRTMRAAPPIEILLPSLVVVIACEEIVWRGVLVNGPRTLFLSAIGYTISQLGAPSLLLAPIAFGCGLLWGVERLWRGSLVAPFLTHLVWSLLTLVYFPLDVPFR